MDKNTRRLIACVLAIQVLILASIWTVFALLRADAVKAEDVSNTPSNEEISGSADDASEDEKWEKVSIPMFSEGSIVIAESENGKIEALRIKVKKGMEIFAPVDCSFGRSGSSTDGREIEGFSFYASQEDFEDGYFMSMDFYGEGIDYISQHGKASQGELLGSFKSDGELLLIAESGKRVAVEGSDPAAWYEEAVKQAIKAPSEGNLNNEETADLNQPRQDIPPEELARFNLYASEDGTDGVIFGLKPSDGHESSLLMTNIIVVYDAGEGGGMLDERTRLLKDFQDKMKQGCMQYFMDKTYEDLSDSSALAKAGEAIKNMLNDIMENKGGNKFIHEIVFDKWIIQ